MAKLIGVVSKVIGQVFAVASDGSRRPLIEGDRLFAGEQLETGAAGAVAVHLQNGAELTLGRDSSLEMTPDLLASQAPHGQGHEAAPSDAQLSDVERIQRAIAAGDDPTQSAEATAAGPGSGSASGAVGGGHSFVMLSEVGARVDPVVGFPTAGFNGFPELANREVGGLDPSNGSSLNGRSVGGGDGGTGPVTIDENHPVTLLGLDIAPGELSLNEANLPLGSASDAAALTRQGSFTVVAQDGVFNLSVGGINVVTGGVVTGVGQSITTGLGNILTITGYNSSTGEVSYTYTLTASGQHIENDGAKSLTEQLPVLVSDSDGDVAQGSLDVIIHDDAPQAFDDGNVVKATEQQGELTGNVLTNDVQGADRVAGGPVIAGTYTGTYGTLVLAADGSYTYTLNPNAPDFKNLGGGGNGVENFTYTIKDADGDTSTATLTLNISNLNDPVNLDGLDVQNGELTVYEKHLSDGTAPDANALTQQGTFKVTAPDGLQSLTVGGIAVVTGGVAAGFPQSVTTPEGNTLTITGYNPSTGVVSYSYTLTDNGSHPDGAGSNSISEHFAVVAKDVDGSTASGSLDVNIVDDVPKAVDDSNAVTATEQHTELTGNVLTNDVQGADRVVGGPVIAGTFTGTYGTLVLAADGSYTYTLNPNAPDFKSLGGGGNGVENFTYTIKDADGDTSTATLTLNISNLNDPVNLDGLDVQNGELTVYEKHLSDGTAPDANALTQQGTFKVTAPDGLQSLTVGGIAVVTGGVAAGFPQSVTTPEGNTLTITGYNPSTGVVSYSYTLTDNGSHPDGAGNNSISEHFAVVAKDVDGSTASGSLDVNIVDDVPKAVDDSNAVTATEQHTELTGNVLTNDVQGADRVVGGPVIAGTYTGTYGTLVLAADGSYTYTLNPNAPDFKNLGGGGNGVENFTYTIKDADGDTSTATLTLNISNLNDPVNLDGLDVQNGELTVYEKHLSDGTAPDANALTQQGTFKVTAPDGLQSLTVGGIAVVTGGVAAGFPQSVTTPEGNTLTITGYNPGTGVVSYSYTLTDNGSHPDGAGSNSISEHFAVVAKDVDGSTASGSLDVNIVDDVPQAAADSTSVVEGGTATGNVLWNDKLGADQAGTSNVVVGARAGSDTSTSAIGNLNTAIAGQYGTLTIDAAGNAVYHANPNAVLPPGASDVFVYTIRDTDGDESTTTITINVQDCSLVAGPVGGVTVHESALDVHQDGNDLAPGSVTGSDPDSTRETASGSLAGSASGGVGALTYSLVSDATGQYGQLHLNADGTYTYTLTSPATSPAHANDGPNTVTETFAYQVKDSLGNSTTSTIVITIVDDVPQAHSDYTSVYKGDEVRGNVLYNDVVGADVRSDGNYVVGVRAGSDTSTSVIGQLNTQVNGQYGYLTIDEKGNAVYHSNPDVVSPRDAVDTFVYTIRDADGDESTTTITINVHNSLMACADRDVTVYENALDLHKDGNDLAAGSVTGSDPDSTRETASGTLVGSASGGVGALTYSLVSDATGQYGQLHLNADGTYTYTLTSPATSPAHANDGPNTVTETFTYQVKDSLGNSTTSTIVITIVDDVPQAHSDYTSVYKGDEVRGNVLYNDVVGADVRSDGNYVVGVRAGSDTSTSAIGQLNTQVNGQYGYLTIDEKGNAVYHSNPDVVSPRDAVDTFVYTIRDADGDESTTTITINVHDPRIEVCMDGGVTVFEKALDGSKDGGDLAAGTVTGSDPTSPLETATGSLAGLASGGIGALSYSLVGNAVGQYGQIQLNADGSYTYTLTSPASSPVHANDGANSVTESFTYQVQDAYGHSATSTIVITIVDDVPQAHSDYTSVYKGDEVRGNVLYNDVVGADVRSDGNYVVGVRAGSDTSTSVIGQLNTQVNGQYGYLTIDEKGNAVYHSNPDVVSPRDAVDTFVYTIRDADGDESTTTITINVHNSLMACADRDVTVYENALDLHKDGNDLAAGSVTGSDPDSTRETASGTLVGSASGGVGALTYSLVSDATGQYGQLHLNADGTYTYTLTSPATSPAHANDGPNTVTETFTYQVKDSLGNSTTSTIVITIVDDVPQAHSDYTSVYKGDEVRGNVLYNDVVGADVRSDGNYVVGVRAGSDTSTSAIGQLNTQVNGQYGYLTIDEKGNAVYHSNPDVVSPRDAVDTFVYTIRDADGDESTTTITINVHDPRIEVCMDGGVTVFEKALDGSKEGGDLAAGTVTGSDPTSPLETATGSLAGLASGGIGALSYSLVGNAVGQYGQIQLNADGSYTYTLTSPASSPVHANDGANSATESFTYQVQDAYGHSATSTIVITIVDDVPQAHSDYTSVYKGDEVRGNVLYNDVVGADVRSDGNYVVGVRAGSDTSTSAVGQLNTQVNGQYGYLSIDEKGNAVYHSNPDVVSPRDAVDTFVYTIRDADGDESTTTITINVHDPRIEVCMDGSATVFEKALDLSKDGGDLAAGTVTGSDPTSPLETASGSLVGLASGGIGALSYSLVGNAVGQYGQISVNPDGSYTYTLTSPANTPGDDSAVENFTYKATDSLGHSITGSIAITIVDDVPNAVCAERIITPDQVDSNILLVIDVSSSMASASGIPGMTRLEATKQAISALLDKYDDMGDIKVQIVTFGSGAQIQSAEWVGIDVAKSIVNGLHAGGSTYYDSAATAAQTAFAQNGKLADAQNVSYFFSDGEPTSGHAITGARETSWESFLDSNGIKAYAIGLGKDINVSNLDPLAYDGSSHTDTHSAVVTNLDELYGVLSDTVQGSPITGSLLSGGTFGADGGFIKALLVDGTTYTYDPKANAGQGGYLASGGADQASFDTAGNTLTIKTSLGGSLLVNMDSGEFTYTPPKGSDSQVERFGFTVSDNDGDTSSTDLMVWLNGNHAPVAVADHVITNIAGASISLPSDVLLANDSDAENDRLSAVPITVNTDFANKGAGFTLGNTVPNITFDGDGDSLDNQFKALERSAFTTAAGSMTAALVVLGYLGNINSSNANGEDVITVSLRKGETLQLDHDRPDGNLSLAWKDASGSYQPIADGGSFTASHDGVYSIHVVNQANPSDNSKAAESYKLSMVVDYSNAVNEVHQASYTVSDGHGGSATGAVDITYQAGATLNGTAGDDVLMASNADTLLNGGDGHDVLVGGAGNDTLHGGNGNDLLIGGLGNDLLDGGAGNDTASYASATGGVTVDLSLTGPQHTGAAGVDTLTGIENLIGSDYDDTLIGDAGDNLLNGGLGNDVLKGGDGNDIIIGGPGNDIMTGGNGNDTFVWQKGDTGHDTVTDFTPGSDHLDLSQLLQGENATAASLDDYLHFKVSGSGSNVVSTIEVSSVAGAAPTQTIDLAGVDLAQHYGVTAGAGGVVSAGQDTATIINGMINDHSLKVDTV